MEPEKSKSTEVQSTPDLPQDNLRIEYQQLSEHGRAWADLIYKGCVVFLGVQGFGLKFLFDAPKGSQLALGLLIFLVAVDTGFLFVWVAAGQFARALVNRLTTVCGTLGIGLEPVRAFQPRCSWLIVVMVVLQMTLLGATLCIYFFGR